MTVDSWDDIDGGWEDVDVGGQKKKRRTRARGSRGKRRATAQTAPVTSPPPKASKKKRSPKPPKAGAKNTNHGTERTRKGRGQEPSKPWLFPLLAFFVGIVVFVLYLLASKS